MVGRGPMLEAVSEHIRNGTSIMLAGQAGVGKSRLALEVVEGFGDRVQRVVASPALSSVNLAALASIGQPSGFGPGDVGGLISWYLSRWRSSATTDGPPILYIDDAHQLDPMSAGVIRQAVEGGLLIILATVRSGEVLPDDLSQLTTGDATRWTPVAPLSQAETASMVEALAGHEAPSVDFDAVWRTSCGVPLYVRELTAAMLAGETMASSVRLDDLIGRRIDSLQEGDRLALECVALGEPLDPRIAESVATPSCIHTLRNLNLVTLGPTGIRVSHPLIASWIIAQLGSSVSSRYELLARGAGQFVDADRVRTAIWLRAAGMTLDPVLARRSVSDALQRLDPDLGLRLLEGQRPDEHLDVLRATALLMKGLTEEAKPILVAALEFADPELVASAAVSLARTMAVVDGDVELAQDLLATTRQRVTGPADRNLVGAKLIIYSIGGHVDWTLVEEAEAAVRPSELDTTTAANGVFAATLLTLRGYDTRGAAITAMVKPKLSEGEDAMVARVALELQAGFGQCMRGDQVGALGRMDAAASAEIENGYRGAALFGGLCYCNCVGGSFNRAVELAASAVASGGATHMRMGRVASHMGLIAEVWRGNADAVAAQFGVAADLDSEARSLDLENATLEAASATYRIATGRPVDSKGLRSSLDLVVANDKHAWAALTALNLLVVRPPDWLACLLNELSDCTPDPGLWHVLADLANGWLTSDAAIVAAAASALDSCGFYPIAAHAWSEVNRLSRRSDPSVAFSSALKARQAISRCDPVGPRWQPNVDPVLTDRQLEIANAAAGGMSAKELATKLHLAERTVNNHLYRIYRAVGVEGRDALRDLMTPGEVSSPLPLTRSR